jgi:hypothetical protein
MLPELDYLDAPASESACKRRAGIRRSGFPPDAELQRGEPLQEHGDVARITSEHAIRRISMRRRNSLILACAGGVGPAAYC